MWSLIQRSLVVSKSSYKSLTSEYTANFPGIFVDKPAPQAFLGELVFHPSPQTPAQPKATFLSQA